MRLPLIKPADILLPKDISLSRWCVVACDQYTSQPQYWENVHYIVGEEPSAYHLVYPECYLKTTDTVQYTHSINNSMARYLEEGIFRTLERQYILVKRILRDGRCRWGLMAAVDLEAYDYRPGSRSPIRATEGTVLERIPPRMAVRRDAPLELPHIMLLMDDLQDKVLGPLKTAAAAGKKSLTLQYQGELMAQSGQLQGWSLDFSMATQLEEAIDALPTLDEMVFAVGDGNHSLATAKECFEELKKSFSWEHLENHPARYVLVEIINLYDPSLEFEPIHRLVTKVNPESLIKQMHQYLSLSTKPVDEGQRIWVVTSEGRQELWVVNPTSPLAVGMLQPFLDEYLAVHGGEIDYIHGGDVLEKLAQAPGTVGFLLPPMDKTHLFPAVVANGVLPRKTFSMGNAEDKRFYLECRKIK